MHLSRRRLGGLRVSVLRRSGLAPRPRGSGRRTALAFAFFASLAISTAQPASTQQGAEASATTRVESGAAQVAVEESLDKLDDLLAQLDERARDAWERAEEVLHLADAATDPDEQMRLEELYGKMAALASGFEEQRSRLRALRDELADTADRMRR